MPEILVPIGDALSKQGLRILYCILSDMDDDTATLFMDKLTTAVNMDLTKVEIIENLSPDECKLVISETLALFHEKTPSDQNTNVSSDIAEPRIPVNEEQDLKETVVYLDDEESIDSLASHTKHVTNPWIRDLLDLSPFIIAILLIVGGGIYLWYLTFCPPDKEGLGGKYADQIVTTISYIFITIVGWVFGASMKNSNGTAIKIPRPNGKSHS